MKVAIGLVIVVAVVGSGIYASYVFDRTPVETAEAMTSPISAFVEEQGKTRLPRDYEITMPFAARLQEITCQEGDAVKANDVVARLVEFDLQNEVDAAQAASQRLAAAIIETIDKTVEETGKRQTESYVESMNLTVEAADEQRRSAKKKLEVAQSQYERVKAAYETQTRAVTLQALEEMELAYVEAEVNYTQYDLIYRALQSVQAASSLLPTVVQQYIDRKDLTKAVQEEEQAEAKARLAMAEERMRRGVLKSPVDGVILERAVVNEQFLPAGQLLLRIGRLEELEVEADILSQDVVDVQEGNIVELFGPTIGVVPIRGAVKRIYPAGFTKTSSLGVEQQRVKVVISIDPDDLLRLREEQKLGVGFRVRTRIHTARKSQAIVIPRSALFRSPAGAWQVFAVRDGKADLQEVQVGLLNDDAAEIREGLDAGERVILAPETTLEDGSRVSFED